MGGDKLHDEQPDIEMLVRTAVGAAEMGKGWAYLNEVNRLVWNGQKVPWNAHGYLYVRNAIQAAGIDADALMADVKKNPEKYDRMAYENQDLQVSYQHIAALMCG